MAKGRCNTCKHWKKEFKDWGACMCSAAIHEAQLGGCSNIFGCVYHEKDKKE